MQASTKSALKGKLAEWQLRQEMFFTSVSRLPRPAQQEAYMLARRDRRKEKRRKRRLAAAKMAANNVSPQAVAGGSPAPATVPVTDGAGLNRTPSAMQASASGGRRQSTAGGSLASPISQLVTDPTSQRSSFETFVPHQAVRGDSSSSESSVDTLTGCQDEEVLEIYPSLSRHDKNTLKQEDKLAVARAAHSVEFLSAKVEFLEDMLYLYQTEVDFQIKVNSSATYVKELKGDLNDAEDRVSYVSTQLRKALDEVTTTKKDKEHAIQALTTEFERATQRERERHEIAVRDFEHERQLLKAKVKAVEANASDSVAVAKAYTASEAVAMRNRIENYTAQIQALEETVQQEQKLRTKLETDLWELNQKLQATDKLNDLVKVCTHNLQEVIAKELRNQRHIYGEVAKVFIDNSKWQWQGDPKGIVAMAIHSQQAKKAAVASRRSALGFGVVHDADGNSTTRGTPIPEGQTSTAPLAGGGGPTVEPPDESELNMGLYDDVMKGVFPEAVDVTEPSSPGTSMERFMRLAEKLNIMLSQYQGDLLQAVTTGCESLSKEKSELKRKLLECYANAELQGRRTEELSRLWEGQKEMASADRDRALALRDRLARQLRMDGGGHERRLTKNAEAQTTIQGAAGSVLGPAAALPSALKSGAGAERRGVTIQDSRAAKIEREN